MPIALRQILTLLVLISFVACSKNPGGEKDRELPVLTLTTPTANQAFTNGQTVLINGTITDNQKISEVHVHITDVTSGTLLVDIHRYPGSSNYTLSESFIVTGLTTFRIQVIAKDNSANENRATVSIFTF